MFLYRPAGTSSNKPYTFRAEEHLPNTLRQALIYEVVFGDWLFLFVIHFGFH